MKFIGDRDTLLREIAVAQDIIASKQVISILSNIYLEADGGSLLIKATDIRVNFSTRVPVTVEESGSTTVPGARFYQILSNLSDGEFTFTHTGSKVTITSKKTNYYLKTLSSEKYPEFPAIGDAKSFEMPIKDFKDMITQTIFAVTDDQTRPVMTGVLLEKVEGKLVMVATDGRRLSYAENDLGDVIEDFPAVIVPVKALNVVQKRAGAEGPISLCVTENIVFFKFGAYEMSSQLLEGQFPNYRRVIPTDHEYECVVNRVALLDVIKSVTPLLEERQKILKVFLNIKLSGLSITTEENEVGTFDTELPCKYVGNDAVIAFNNKYLEEPLKVIETDEVKITFNDTTKAVMIKAEPEKNYFHIVMPMQT